MDTHRLAARLRVDYGSLADALKNEAKIARELRSCEYDGILSGFLGRRWWRTKIESLLWDLTDGQSSDSEAVFLAIRKVEGDIEPSNPAVFPVVCIDESYQPEDSFSSTDLAVRLSPDDWPSYADQPWATMEKIKENPKLASLVIEEDRYRIK